MTIQDIRGSISSRRTVRPNKLSSSLPMKLNVNTTQKILAIRSDSVTEFKSYTLDKFLGDDGIKHQHSAAYTPQQNGVAERKNHTLMDMARSMMPEFKSSQNFWAESISTACHYSNCLYLCKVINKTPYEILNGKRPNAGYFR